MTTDLSRQESIAAEAYPAATRLDSLDMLRGLCALVVAIYHFNLWGGLAFPSASSGISVVAGVVCPTQGIQVIILYSIILFASIVSKVISPAVAFELVADKLLQRRMKVAGW